jgi:uroporphyrin-3 C-methyltransferase
MSDESPRPAEPEQPSPPPAPAAPAPAAPPALTQMPVWTRMAQGLNTTSVIAILALALAAWQWTTSQRDATRLQTEVARKLAETEASSKEVRLIADQVRNSVRDVESRLGLMEAKLIESQNQRIALESLYQELARNRDEWVLAEIEQILVTANQQLQLAGNVRSALIALEAADKRLAQADRLGLLSLRRVITRDIERLKSAATLDVPGMTLKLDTMIAGIDAFPLAADRRPSAETPRQAIDRSTWNGFATELWADLKDMLRVRFADARQAPLLAPESAFFLRENLKLKLMGARVALMSRNETGFRGDIRAAEQWLSQHFDLGEKSVSLARTQLRHFAQTELAEALPDIGDSLQAVRDQAGSPRGPR